MEKRYAPLVFPTQLHAMPTCYQSKIPLFDAIVQYVAQQHVNKISNYFELHEIDEADVDMRLFTQTLTGDVKKWFKAFPANHIENLANFQRLFIAWWEKKNNLLQILSKYETIQDYCTRFNNIYNAILVNIRPSPDLVLIMFPDGFDTDMSHQLRERSLPTLEEIQSVAISVESNLLAKRARVRNEKIIAKDEASPSDLKIDNFSKNMEILM